MIFCQSCSIGIKTKYRIVYVGYSKSLIEAKGAIRIATNKKIPITVQGKVDVDTKRDLGGMYVISKPDLKVMFAALKELKKLKQRKP